MDGLVSIHFPEGKIQRRKSAGSEEIYDPVRKSWVVLTPEEWVRQNFIQFLLTQGYPVALMAVERQIKLGSLVKRFDIVVFSRAMIPFMIVECKRMDVALTQKVLEQALRYHISLNSEYLVITNGNHTIVFHKKNDRFEPVNSFPGYPL
ncbi:MAG: type I restriction enzyme HsdR N-terminal domain-containing protein [Chitinophagaceae bacterium]|nr:type I restriction enzyme HsdR N-terminal domain-containing protein [Chitinophagaceae bacterium]